MRASIIAASPVLLGALQKLHLNDKLSFLETDAALSQKLERAEQEAKKNAVSAQEAWKESPCRSGSVEWCSNLNLASSACHRSKAKNQGLEAREWPSQEKTPSEDSESWTKK